MSLRRLRSTLKPLGWGLLLAAGSLPAVAADTSVSADEVLEPWEYPVPALWFGDYRSAEQAFGLIQARWLRAKVLHQNAAIAKGELKQAEVSYRAVRLTLQAQQNLLDQDIGELERALQEARGAITLSTLDPTLQSEALLELDAQVEEFTSRADQAMRSMTSQLHALGGDGIAPRDAARRWWELHLQHVRANELPEAGSATLAQMDNALLELRVSAQGLDDASRSLIEDAVLATEQEWEQREAREALVDRLRNPDDRLHQGAELEQVRRLEQALFQRQRRRAEIEQEIDRIDRDLASLSLEAPASAEDADFEALKTEVTQLRATYDRLYLGMATLSAHVSMDAWCRVHVHGALLRVMLAEDGAPGLLQNAAAAYGGTCSTVMADQLEVASFAALWAEALLRLRLADPAYVQLSLGPGAWTLDGTPLVGGGTSTFTVAPGVHRVEYNENGRVIASEERIDPGERLCIGLTRQGNISLDPCPIGAPGGGPLLPTRAPYSAHLEDVDEPTAAVRPRTFVTLSGQWIRLAGIDGPTDMPGANLELAWRLGRAPSGLLHLIFDQDLAYSPVDLALTDTLVSSLLLRERVGLAIIPNMDPVIPTVELGSGFLMTFRGKDEERAFRLPPMLVYLGLGARVQLSEHLYFTSSLGGEQVLWRDGAFEPMPTARMGLSLWM